MNLVIGENEGKILEYLSPSREHTTKEISKELNIARGSVGTTLKKMQQKGWLTSYLEGDYNVYKLSVLGRKALDAWRVYFGKERS